MSRARTTAPALAVALCAALLTALFGAGAARAETAFGGLGQFAKTIQLGEGPGQIDLEKSKLDFVVEPGTGTFFVSQQVQTEEPAGSGKFTENARVSKYSSAGAFEGTSEFSIGKLDNIHGLALDPVSHVLYVATEIENTITGRFHVDALWSISTPAMTEAKKLVSGIGLTNKEHFVEPVGLAVDPNHQVLLAGYKEEAKGPEKVLRAALQVVHPEGVLGPRYVDKAGCLTGETPTGEEELNCARITETEGTLDSLVATRGGHALTEVSGETLWELPDPKPEEAFKLEEITPHMRFAFEESSAVRFEAITERQGETIYYGAGAGAGEGTLFAGGEVGHTVTGGTQPTQAVIAFNVNETGAEPVITERGWTGGQEVGTRQPKCLIPLPNAEGGGAVMVGAAPNGSVVVFDITQANPVVEANFQQFGALPGAEPCGHANLTSPSIELGEKHNLTEAPVGKAVTLASKLEGADALSDTWTINGPGGKHEELHSTFNSPAQRLAPTLEHDFETAGEYEVTEHVQSDNLGAPSVTVTRKIVAALPPISVELEPVAGGLRAGSAVAFKSKPISDTNEPEPKLQLTWTFGDGSAPEHVELKGGQKVSSVNHVFAKPCTCKVTLHVEDARKAEGTAAASVTIAPSVAEEEAAAKQRAAEEAARRAAEEAARLAREAKEHEQPAGGVKPHVEKHDPAATIAGATVTVAANGSASITVSCPADEEGSCEGTLTLRTLSAVSAKKGKKSILTLAGSSFKIAGGTRKTLVLHLSSKARALLARSHTLKALAIVAAHDSAGLSKKTESHVTLKLAPKKKHH